ncbi:MAG: 4-hydroxy-tetrahydrodipicolinate synthase [Bacteroidales bacterium]|nr:4-hydroxy-tetrahydrodipicolinate synthase [Candidatus Cryptobacteroides onthequi]
MKFKGCGTALLTPFKNNGADVDYDAVARLVDRQVEAGVHFLVPLGTTGETPCLTEVERIKILQVTKEHSQGRPILVGGGTNSLAQTIASIKTLDPFGPDAFLIVVPYYNKPTQKGLFEYFKAVAESTDKDIVLYNVPGRTGANIEAETTIRLAEEVPNIVAVKEASGRYAQISQVIRNRPQGFSVLSGNDDETLSLMATGADGVISVASNVDPARMVALVESLERDDMKTARELHYKLMPLFKNCFVESNPIPAKAALAQLGLMENSLRLPLFPATEATEAIMRETLAELF